MHLVPFLLFARYKSLHPPMGCTHHTLYLIYLPIKLASIKNLINFAENILILGFMYYAKSNYPIASVGLCPPDPLLLRYNSRVSPSPQQILDPPLVEVYCTAIVGIEMMEARWCSVICVKTGFMLTVLKNSGKRKSGFAIIACL